MKVAVRWSMAVLVVASSSVVACREDKATPPEAGAPAREVALAGSVVLIGAGDIARCNSNGDERTAAIVDSVLAADSVVKVETAVFTIGDNAYSAGTAKEFARCFTASWGTKTIMNVIRPSPGNHEYRTPNAVPYYDYFAERAGPRLKGFYSFDIGEWHVISLNSEIAAFPGSAAAKEQEAWLIQDLADNPKACTLAYFHRPLFSSGEHGSSGPMRRLWEIMFPRGVDLILGGHDHHYERFRPQTPAGVADSVRGIPEIVIGTGGGDLRGVSSPRARNSVAAVHGYFGVLKLNLGPGEFTHAFIDTSGRIWDSGRGVCH